MGNGRFAITRVRPGYAMAEVDAFIARIEGTLGTGPATASPVTADEVRSAIFPTVRLRPGYDERDVDEALDRYEQELRRRGS
jgi:DivIVA domain-containing protein